MANWRKSKSTAKTKGTFINALDIEKFTAKQKDTINVILESIAEVFKSQMIVKSRRLNIRIPTKRAFSADSYTSESLQTQKMKNDQGDSPFSTN